MRSRTRGVIQASAPAHIIEGGIPPEALLAQIAVAKYADGLPLYRQEALYAREKVEFDRQLLAQWMGKLGFELEIMADYILRGQEGRTSLCRRNHLVDARSRLRIDKDGLFMGLCQG